MKNKKVVHCKFRCTTFLFFILEGEKMNWNKILIEDKKILLSVWLQSMKEGCVKKN